MPLGINEIAQLSLPKETSRELLGPMEWSQYMSNALVTDGSLINDERTNQTKQTKNT